MRERWASRTVFIFAAIGSAVGLGNIWRYPYITYKFGGGAFIIPYLISLLLVGLPLLMLEFAVGQRFQKGAVKAFRSINKKLGGIGVLAILCGFVIVVYYAVVMAWALMYFIYSFNTSLPWQGNAEGFFYNNVLGITESVSHIGGINWVMFLALLAVWVSIYFIIRKGVHSVGKVVLITVPLPILLLVVLFIRGVTLPGALEGLAAFITPDFSALWDTEIWLAAISQVFFSFSLGAGIMIAYASFNNKNQNVASDTYITGFADAAISFFAGFVVFSILGYMAFASNVGIADVVTSGPGLAFVVFPEALSLLPMAWLFSLLFFLTLLTLGIDSAFSIVESINTVLGDNYKKPNRPKIAFFTCLVCFLFGILFVTGAGLYFLDIVDHFITNYGLVTVGLLESLAVGWILGAKNLREYVNKTCGCNLKVWWDYAIKFVIPIALVLLIIVQLYRDITVPYEGYPAWALAIGWASVIIPILIAGAYTMWFSKKQI